MTMILMLGSGPDALRARSYPRAPFDQIIAINNAWRLRPDWDALVYPEDFPADRRPATPAPHQRLIEADAFVPAQNAYGGFVYAGGTMAFTASYWALYDLRPSVIAYIGCDMVYPSSGNTHFYGTGTADPLRADITLRSLEAKSARLMVLAAAQGCALVNLSNGPSRLVFPRVAPSDLAGITALQPASPELDAALVAEDRLGYRVPSGRYWEQADQFDPAALDRIDALWLAAAGGLSAPQRA